MLLIHLFSHLLPCVRTQKCQTDHRVLRSDWVQNEHTVLRDTRGCFCLVQRFLPRVKTLSKSLRETLYRFSFVLHLHAKNQDHVIKINVYTLVTKLIKNFHKLQSVCFCVFWYSSKDLNPRGEEENEQCCCRNRIQGFHS